MLMQERSQLLSASIALRIFQIKLYAKGTSGVAPLCSSSLQLRTQKNIRFLFYCQSNVILRFHLHIFYFKLELQFCRRWRICFFDFVSALFEISKTIPPARYDKAPSDVTQPQMAALAPDKIQVVVVIVNKFTRRLASDFKCQLLKTR